MNSEAALTPSFNSSGVGRSLCSIRQVILVHLCLLTAWLMLSCTDISKLVAQDREGGRSREREVGPRRSAEEQAGPRRSPEGERFRNQNPNSGDREQIPEALRGFRPQNPREAALLQMIVQLQKEVAELRLEIRSKRNVEGPRRDEGAVRDGQVSEQETPGDSPNSNMRYGDFRLPDNWQRTKEGKVFLAYDKNRDNEVSLDEWLAMTNGNLNEQRRQISTGHFNTAEPSGDGKFTPAEFIWWRQIGSRQGPRDGEGQRQGPRDGEGQRQGPRDGQGNH